MLSAKKKETNMENFRNQLPKENDRKNFQKKFADNLFLYTYESQFGVSETMSKLEQNIKSKEIPIFAIFDHGMNAEKAGLKLHPNQVIVFGSPQVGTILMQENPAISIELPLRISVWEDDKGKVWITFPNLRSIGERYNIQNSPVIEKMHKLLLDLAIKSAINNR